MFSFKSPASLSLSLKSIFYLFILLTFLCLTPTYIQSLFYFVSVCLSAYLSFSPQLPLGFHVQPWIPEYQVKKKQKTLFPLLENYDDFLIQLNTFILLRKCELCLEKKNKLGELAAFRSFSNISHNLSIMLSVSYSAQSPKRLWFTCTVETLKLEQKLKRGKGNNNLRGNYLQSLFSKHLNQVGRYISFMPAALSTFLCCL